MTAPDRARLCELHDLYVEMRLTEGEVHEVVTALPALLDALDEYEKALRIIEIGARVRPRYELQRVAREALARIGAE